MNPDKIVIRRAVEADYGAINSLYHRNYLMYHENIPDSYKEIPAIVLTRGDFINILDCKEDIMLVAEDDGKVIGQLYALVDDQDSGYISTGYHRVEVAEISINPEYARMGIGTKLMLEVEKWAKENKIDDLSVLVYDFNKEATSFYEANGYKSYSIRMQKKIE